MMNINRIAVESRDAADPEGVLHQSPLPQAAAQLAAAHTDPESQLLPSVVPETRQHAPPHQQVLDHID